MSSSEGTHLSWRIWDSFRNGVASSIGALRLRATLSSSGRWPATASRATYRYDELPDHSFRYLILQPGVGDEPLVCTLHTTNLYEVEYEAISYVWGTEVQDYSIRCNDTIFKITPNLNEALRQVRRADAPRNLWVDSICINQQDLIEKGHQVAMMGQIYKSATCVLICVGSVDSELAPGLQKLAENINRMIDEALYHAIYGGRSDSVTSYRSEHHLDSTSEPTSHHNNQYLGPDFDYRSAVERGLERPRWDIFPYLEERDVFLRSQEWGFVEALNRNEWFERGWVVREASLARQAVVVWGDTVLQWNDLIRTAIWCGTRAKKDMNMVVAYRMRCHFEAYRTRHHNFSSTFFKETDWFEPSLLDYMGSARGLRLKDPRDRIYAFLELGSTLSKDLDIIPNYSDTPLRVFQDFATNYVLKTKDMNILHHVAHDASSLVSGFPTWVPIWDQRSANMTHFVSPSSYLPLLSRTSRGSNPYISNDEALRVQGVIFDTISLTSDIFTGSGSVTQKIFDIWLGVRALSSFDGPYREKPLEAFFDALALGSHFYGDMAGLRSQQRKYIDLFQHLSDRLNQERTIQWEAVNLRELDSSPFIRQVAMEISGKRLIVTRRGHLGYAPQVTQNADLCAVVFGCFRPCILRAAHKGGCYRFLGTSFVLGSQIEAVDGEHRFTRRFGDEFSRDWQDWDVEEQDICLV
jgi:hypothetical protein